jgi:immunity protein 53 of polymorphic toxin system
MDELRRLQEWYLTQCDGDWEHGYGPRISTLDNPGWEVTIELEDTDYAGVPFAEVKDMAPERDWIRCWVDGTEWHGVGGPLMLTSILKHFLDWADEVRRTAP